MPQLTGTAILQLMLLLSALPAQYLISRLTGSSVAQRYHTTKRLLGVWNEWWKTVQNNLNGTAWIDWATQLVSQVGLRLLVGEGENEAPGESLDLEAMLQDNDQGFFGASREVRSPRPPFVFLRVGDVVMERRSQMVGVVVSWDPELQAPLEWINRVYPNVAGNKAEHTPHYKVLFSGPSPSSIMVGYLPQTELERVSLTRPDIPTLENYFTHFEVTTGRFVMQPWLSEIFPED